MADIMDAVEVSTSLGGTCFRRVDGTVACFGGEAALASGATALTEHPSPEDVPGLTDVVALESASFGVGTCAIRGAERSVVCWGTDFPAWGLGTSPGLGAAIYALDPPTGVTDIAVGLSHVCVVVDGRVRCLGGNSYGQLGDGRTEPSPTFVDVVLP
ncbi:MAG: RCC1 domain-containing protein [Sandaracinaceae bacterium]